MFELKIVNTFLPISFTICFGCSKEISQQDAYFVYPQHMFWLKIRKLFFYMYSKTSHSKIVKTKILMINGSLMKVESIAECFGLFESGSFRQVLVCS